MNSVSDQPTTPPMNGSKRIEPVLRPQISSRWALKPVHFVIVVTFSVLFVLLNYMPLRATDLWVHVSFGEWILEHHSLPAADPDQLLAEGVPVVNTAWLSQLVLAGIDQRFGPTGLSNMFAVCELATYLILFFSCYRHSRCGLPETTGPHWWAAWLGTIAALVVGWSRISTIRPEMFGAALFAALLVVLSGTTAKPPTKEGSVGVRQRHPIWSYLSIAVIFCLWANLHGSFVCGIGLLACYALGQSIDVFWRTRSLTAALNDVGVRRAFWLLEVAILASFLNPHGIDLWVHILAFSSNSNLRDILEWQPLVVLGLGGREFAFSILVMMLLLRHSRRPWLPAEVLALGLFAAASVWQVRMLAWYALVFGFVATPHFTGILARMFRFAEDKPLAQSQEEEDLDERSPSRIWALTLLSGLAIWIAFSLSPISQPLLGGKPRTERQLLGKDCPIELAAYLKQNPPQGQIFNPQQWGDWLRHAGTEDLRVFVTSNIHLVPHQVWQDYQRVTNAMPGWRDVLDRYDVNTIVLSPDSQPLLEPVLRKDSGWKRTYGDELAQVYVRTGG